MIRCGDFERKGNDTTNCEWCNWLIEDITFDRWLGVELRTREKLHSHIQLSLTDPYHLKGEQSSIATTNVHTLTMNDNNKHITLFHSHLNNIDTVIHDVISNNESHLRLMKLEFILYIIAWTDDTWSHTQMCAHIHTRSVNMWYIFWKISLIANVTLRVTKHITDKLECKSVDYDCDIHDISIISQISWCIPIHIQSIHANTSYHPI